MVQLQGMDARLDTLSTELYQVNVRVGRIARRQATMGNFAPEPTPSPLPLVASDSASRHKLVFPSAITRILRHFSVPFPSFDHFIVMCAIDYAIVKRRKAQFQSRQSDSATTSSHLAPSRSAPSASVPSSLSDVTLGDIMVQLQRMGARLDTFSIKLY